MIVGNEERNCFFCKLFFDVDLLSLRLVGWLLIWEVDCDSNF